MYIYMYMYSLAVAELATRVRKIGAEISHALTGFTDDRRVTKKAVHRRACVYIRQRVGLAKVTSHEDPSGPG